MNSDDVFCLYPVLIVSPTILHDALHSTRICINGNVRLISSSQRFELLKNVDSPSKVLHIPYVESLTEEYINSHRVKEVQNRSKEIQDFVNNSYLCDDDGNMYDVYVFVSCGHCDVCDSKKLSSLIQRCQFAIEESRKPAAFVTLTYNRNHIPSDFRVRKRHIDLFKKRFKQSCSAFYSRIAVPTIVDGELVDDVLLKKLRRSKALSVASDIKFCVASEYGKKGRPHYHMLIFGIPRLSVFDEEHDYFVRKLVQFCWRVPIRDLNTGLFVDFDSYRIRFPRAVFRKGEIPSADEIDDLSFGFINYKEITTSKAAKYVLKYCFKQDKDNRPSFKSVSHNLGVQFVKQYAKKMECGDGKFRYCSYFDHSLKEVNLTSYYIQKLYPSFNRLVPSFFRRDYLDCEYYGRVLIGSSNVPISIRQGVASCLLCVRDLCAPLVFFDDFYLSYKDRDLSLDSKVSVFVNGGSSFIDCHSSVPVFLSHFYSSYSRLIAESSNINWSYIFECVKNRDKLFSHFQKRSWCKKYDIGRKFREDINTQLSKQVLL